jgi:hypothetical protein
MNIKKCEWLGNIKVSWTFVLGGMLKIRSVNDDNSSYIVLYEGIDLGFIGGKGAKSISLIELQEYALLRLIRHCANICNELIPDWPSGVDTVKKLGKSDEFKELLNEDHKS